MKILIIGNNDGPLRLTRALVESGHRVVGVGLQKYTPALHTALMAYCPLVAATPDEAAAADFIRGRSFDLLVNCFANFRYRYLHHRYDTLNVHPSPLPRYRGRHPLQWALINGERQFGITIHRLTDDFDAGAILWQEQISVTPGWSAVELREALLTALEQAWPTFVKAYAAGTIKAVANSEERATHVTRRTPADSRMRDWQDRDRVWRKIRALRHDPHPAYLSVGDQRYVLNDAALGTRRYIGFRTGQVVRTRPDTREVICGDGRTLILYAAFGDSFPVNSCVP